MQKFDREVVVYVWRFVGTRTGHAALKLKAPGLENPAAQGKSHCYVSWWPKAVPPEEERKFGWRVGESHRTYQEDRRNELSEKTRQALARGQFVPKTGQKYAKPGYLPPPGQHQGAQSNPEGWGQSADDKVYLPAMGASNVVFGLDIGAMVRWWHLFNNSGDDEFNILKLNCSRVAAMCLLAGGAGRVCRPPTRALNLWTPNTILAWTQKLEAAYAARNKAVLEIGVTSLPKNDRTPPDLFDLATWKKETKPGTFSIRRDQVLAIDALLGEFASCAKSQDEPGLERAIGVLDRILGQVHSHISRKGDVSRNREVVALLGQQALSAYRLRCAQLAELKRKRASGLTGASKYKLLDEVNTFAFEGDKLGQEAWGT